jgi:hypothetical protein
LPNISTVNGVDITTLASFGGVAFADGQTLDGQDIVLIVDDHVFIDTSGAISSGTSSVSFTSGLDSTYDLYEFHFINMHPSGSFPTFTFQVNAAGQTGFNEEITGGAINILSYVASAYNQSAGTSYQTISPGGYGVVNQTNACGILRLENPSSTTYVKNYLFEYASLTNSSTFSSGRGAGYINTTSAIDEINFKFSSGNIDGGEIRFYGIKTS